MGQAPSINGINTSLEKRLGDVGEGDSKPILMSSANRRMHMGDECRK